MENNFDNGAFIDQLDPQGRVVRKNNSIVILTVLSVVLIGFAGYCYCKTKQGEEIKS